MAAVDYFSRYTWAKVAIRNDSDSVIKFLEKKILDKFGMPVGIYMDPGPHLGRNTQNFAESHRAVWCN